MTRLDQTLLFKEKGDHASLILHSTPNIGPIYPQEKTEQKLNQPRQKILTYLNTECLQWKSYVCVSVKPSPRQHIQAEFPMNLCSALLLNELRKRLLLIVQINEIKRNPEKMKFFREQKNFKDTINYCPD